MAQIKKIINDPKNVVAELLDGLVMAYHGKIKKLEGVPALRIIHLGVKSTFDLYHPN